MIILALHNTTILIITNPYIFQSLNQHSCYLTYSSSDGKQVDSTSLMYETGQFSSPRGATGYGACPAGTYSSLASTYCTSCPVGFFIAVAGDSGPCIACERTYLIRRSTIRLFDSSIFFSSTLPEAYCGNFDIEISLYFLCVLFVLYLF